LTSSQAARISRRLAEAADRDPHLRRQLLTLQRRLEQTMTTGENSPLTGPQGGENPPLAELVTNGKRGGRVPVHHHYVRQAGGDGHLAIVLAILATIPTPAERVRWLRARLPESASVMGIDGELLGLSA
jgi:hypothetical protein